MFTRILGRSGIRVSALGVGTVGISGLVWDLALNPDRPTGYGQADDAEAIRAIHRALDLGITLFDTADEYGCGHAERLLGEALVGRRHQVVLATKFGFVIDEEHRQVTGRDASPAYIRRACEASLRRLNSDYIDLYHFHLRDHPLDRIAEVLDTLERLVEQGKIRYYGWSTDDVQRARSFAQGPHCTSVMHRLNLVIDNPEMLALCEEEDLASINRIPLLMGLLTGRHNQGVDLPGDDIRRDWFDNEDTAKIIDQVETLRETLTRDGRTLPQAMLGYIWARSERTIPIPGFRNTRQIEENAAAMETGPLGAEQMAQIKELWNLGRR